MTSKTDDAQPGSARAHLEGSLAQVDAWNGRVNAMMAMNVEDARRTADALDAAAARGEWAGLLHGMTLAIKDNIDTAGIETTRGSQFFKGRVPNADAPVVSRLKRAGAVIVGKATLHEVAFGVRSHNAVIGQCRNPYDTDYIPGGSSGGSGVVVATGMADAALGTDTGGSVRIPAAINGITGLRPTLGRVSNNGCLPVSDLHDTIGPMARSAMDVARLFAVMAGYDDADPTSRDRPLENFLPAMAAGVAGVRIGIPRGYYYDDLAPETAAAVEAALKEFEKLGATLVDIDLPGAEDMQSEATVVIFCDAAHLHAERMREPDKWGAQTIERLRLADDFTGRDYARAMRAREQWMRTLKRTFDNVDMLAMPTLPQLTPPIEDDQSLFEATRRVAANTYPGAFGALPGLSVPCGASEGGLPIGLLLEGPWWDEPRLLRAGHAYQQVTEWHRRRPVPA
ncbi:MAG: amidase [Hyphomicrobiaceae bacterium]